jgi:phosphatidylserine decarboxylase
MTGCSQHGITQEVVDKRYAAVYDRVMSTPEDDHEAQWSSVFACVCCTGPCRWYDQDKEPRCSHCA